MGLLRWLVGYEKPYKMFATKQPTPLVDAISTFVHIYNTEVLDEEDQPITRDDVVRWALNGFMKKNLWIYGKEQIVEKPKENKKVTKIEDARPKIRYTTGMSQSRS